MAGWPQPGEPGGWLTDAAQALSGFARPSSPGGLLGDALGGITQAAMAQTPEQRRMQAYFDWYRQASPQERADDAASPFLGALPQPQRQVRQDFAEGETPPLTAGGQRTSDALAGEIMARVGQPLRDDALAGAMRRYRELWPWASRLAGP